MGQETSTANYWTVTKRAVSGSRGLVASQHYVASRVGAEVLRNGGNAVDAAVAAGLALGTVEPWMSGIGGGGYMTLHLAATNATHVIEFGMRAPLDATRDDYPILDHAPSGSGFNWPRVLDDRNIHGPLSIAVPGYIKGVSLALKMFGSLPWHEVIQPACQQAEAGVPIDWYASHHVSRLARTLAMYDEARRTVMPDGLPPTDKEGPIRLGRLANTYAVLRDEGPDSYYFGTIAERVAEDLEAVGSRIRRDDLASYTARVSEPLQISYRDARISVAGDLTAGPSLAHCLRDMESNWSCESAIPNVSAYLVYVKSLLQTFKHRLMHLGEGADPQAPSNTSHLCVVDAAGNLVSLTQTIMSGFGSCILLPQTGIFMNNGMYWFDPREGKPNSLVGGRRPLCNMCPVIGELDDGSTFALGACGGRTILAAVVQLISFLVDFRLSVDSAVHQPRADVSGMDLVTVMEHIDQEYLHTLKEEFKAVKVQPNSVSPILFGIPQLIKRFPSGRAEGGCFVPSPHACVVAA